MILPDSVTSYVSIYQFVGNKAKLSQIGHKKKTKHAKFPEKQIFLPSDLHTEVCVSGSKKSWLLGKFGVLCFLVTPVLRFTLSAYYCKETFTIKRLILAEINFCGINFHVDQFLRIQWFYRKSERTCLGKIFVILLSAKINLRKMFKVFLFRFNFI